MNIQQNIDIFISLHADKFPEERLYEIRQMLHNIDENRFRFVQSIQYKDPTTMLLISIFVGSYGVDRFMLGQTALGVLKLLTCGGCFVWHIVDIFLVSRETKNFNFERLRAAIS